MAEPTVPSGIQSGLQSGLQPELQPKLEPSQLIVGPLADGTDSRVLNLYEKREKIYVRSIEGFFQKIRLFTGWPLLLGYFGAPWLSISGHQAILFDLPSRKFHIFWLTFWPQDFSLLAWALVIAAFSLFFFTTLLGRVWCGYSCPQTVWTAIFMWAEQTAEGERHQRIKLDKSPWSFEKMGRRCLKHTMWLGFAAATGVTFVSYFYGMSNLLVDAAQFQVASVAVFWIAFFTLATYINAGWMREQVCMYMCPYARFQAAMFDEDTLIVSYDEKRGEPRGSRKRGLAAGDLASDSEKDSAKGDCIDCSMCVQVCPTGIDIRDGLQYECINCALCIDACDSVMEKMGYAPRLILYTTQNQLAGRGWKWQRPKLLGYGAAVVVMLVTFATVLATRVPLAMDVLRSRGTLYQEVSGGFVQNVYQVKVMNMDKTDHRYRLSVSGAPDYRLVPDGWITVAGGEIEDVSVNLLIDPDLLTQVNTKLVFSVQTEDGELTAKSDSTFIGPEPL